MWVGAGRLGSGAEGTTRNGGGERGESRGRRGFYGIPAWPGCEGAVAPVSGSLPTGAWLGWTLAASSAPPGTPSAPLRSPSTRPNHTARSRPTTQPPRLHACWPYFEPSDDPQDTPQPRPGRQPGSRRGAAPWPVRPRKRWRRSAAERPGAGRPAPSDWTGWTCGFEGVVCGPARVRWPGSGGAPCFGVFTGPSS